MPQAYTEAQLVEQPAIGLFAAHSAGPNPHPRPALLSSRRDKRGNCDTL